MLDKLCKKFVLSHHSSLHNVLCYGSTRTQIMLKHSFFDLKLEPLEDRRKNRKSIVSTQLAGSDLSVRLKNSKSVLCVLFLLDKNWQALIWVDRHLCKTIITRFNIKSIVAFEYVQRVPAWMDVDDGEVGGDL